MSAPSGSSRTTSDIDATTDEAPAFTADVAGTYTFDLIVDNGDTESTPTSLDVTVTTRPTNSSPVTRAGSDQTGSGSSTSSFKTVSGPSSRRRRE